MVRQMQTVKFYGVQDRRSNTHAKLPWVVRYTIDGRHRSKSFRTRIKADRYRGRLLQAVQNGGRCDETSREPGAWQTPLADLCVHEGSRRWLAEQWQEGQPRTRASATEALARFITIAVEPGARTPEGLRVYLNTALAPGADSDHTARAATPMPTSAVRPSWRSPRHPEQRLDDDACIVRCAHLEGDTTRVDGDREVEELAAVLLRDDQSDEIAGWYRRSEHTTDTIAARFSPLDVSEQELPFSDAALHRARRQGARDRRLARRWFRRQADRPDRRGNTRGRHDLVGRRANESKAAPEPTSTTRSPAASRRNESGLPTGDDRGQPGRQAGAHTCRRPRRWPGYIVVRERTSSGNRDEHSGSQETPPISSLSGNHEPGPPLPRRLRVLSVS